MLKVGSTLVMVTSEIDLSVGSATALGVLVTRTLKDVAFPPINHVPVKGI